MKQEAITLASASLQRHRLLIQHDIPHHVIIPNIEEDIRHRHARKIVSDLAKQKCLEVIPKAGTRLVLSADTLVTLGRHVYGKVKTRELAAKTLRTLSGKTHRIWTGICLYDAQSHHFIERVELSKITFRSLSEQIIQDYLNTGEWKDAAGCYRIQARGESLVKRLKGSYSAVSGLPIHTLYDILSPFGY